MTVVLACKSSSFVFKNLELWPLFARSPNACCGRIILMLFHWYICVCVYISYNAHKRCTKETFVKWSNVNVNVFSVLGSIPSGTIDINLITNCDKPGISTVAICDLSQFVTKTVSWQIQSNNIENVSCVLGRVPMFTFCQDSERLSFDPFLYYLPYVLYIFHQTWGAGINLGNVSNHIEKVLILRLWVLSHY